MVGYRRRVFGGFFCLRSGDARGQAVSVRPVSLRQRLATPLDASGKGIARVN